MDLQQPTSQELHQPRASTPSSASADTLIEVKSEDEEQACVHSVVDQNGVEYPMGIQLETGIWPGVEDEVTDIHSMLTKLDAVLFQHNMRGWYGMQDLLGKHHDKFRFYYMNCSKSSGARGFMMACKACDRRCRFQWDKKMKWDDEHLERCRIMMRNFLTFGTEGRKRQRIV